MIKRMIVAVVILFAVLLLMLPKTDDTSKNKMASAAMLMCSNDYRKAVAELLRNNTPLDLAFTNNCPKLISSLVMGESGDITIHGAKYGIVLTLTPVVKSAEIRWSCKGEPMEAITKLCTP